MLRGSDGVGWDPPGLIDEDCGICSAVGVPWIFPWGTGVALGAPTVWIPSSGVFNDAVVFTSLWCATEGDASGFRCSLRVTAGILRIGVFLTGAVAVARIFVGFNSFHINILRGLFSASTPLLSRVSVLVPVPFIIFSYSAFAAEYPFLITSKLSTISAKCFMTLSSCFADFEPMEINMR